MTSETDQVLKFPLLPTSVWPRSNPITPFLSVERDTKLETCETRTGHTVRSVSSHDLVYEFN